MFSIEAIPSKFRPKSDILALGSDTRQRISWAESGKLFSLVPEKDFLDLDRFFEEAGRFLKTEFNFSPKILTFDPHPLFTCGREAIELKKRYFPKASLCPVGHHMAHVANFAFEAGLKKKFIGLAFDGTGFGTADQRIWGSEFFVYGKHEFRRAAHLDYLELPGNEEAIREPWRIAFALLVKIFGKKVYKMDLAFLKNIPKAKIKLVQEMLEKGFNTPQACSAGRLFDAVAALLNLKTTVSSEAEAAIALEKAAAQFQGQALSYPFSIRKENAMLIVDPALLIKNIVRDVVRQKPVFEIAYRFHLTLAEIILRISTSLKKKYAINDIYLSGGVFMNEVLRREVAAAFLKKDFNLFFAPRPLTTDLGISQGQIAAVLLGASCA